MFPKGKGSYEINAEITKVGFAWMVGPMTVETTTENDEGIPMASTVKIHKCRWLQESACTGMCCNMCKVPTQKFFTETFGLPLTIRPNVSRANSQTPSPFFLFLHSLSRCTKHETSNIIRGNNRKA